MLAAVNVSDSDTGWAVAEIASPRPAAGEAIVRVAACAVCGSDHQFLGAKGVRFTPGHEFAGVIAELGQGVRDWRLGERVVGNPFLFCGQCPFCLAGKQNLCDQARVLGFQGPGAFAAEVAIRASSLIRLPDAVAFEDAALADPIAVDLHALSLVDLARVERAVVLGLGGIGFPAAMLLRERCEVVAIETNPMKMELGRRFGLEVLDGQADPAAALAGRPVDLCLDAVGGRAPTFNLGLRLLRKEGTLLCVSQRHTFEMDFPPLGYRELTVKGVFGHCPRDFQEAVDVIGRQTWPHAMITARYPLADFGPALRAACGGQQLKVVVVPAGLT
jgi:L-iditol 2-dehydrogenase